MNEITLHEGFMRKALTLARKAVLIDEVPVGAIIVKQNKIIGEGHNRMETDGVVSSHAEMIAIKEASKVTNSWRLTGCILYSTLEPCVMCSGTIILSRISTLVFGTRDPKTGAAGSVVDMFQQGMFNHDVNVVKHVLEQECSKLLTDYFKELRTRKKIF